jgi:hypothetical protein
LTARANFLIIRLPKKLDEITPFSESDPLGSASAGLLLLVVWYQGIHFLVREQIAAGLCTLSSDS